MAASDAWTDARAFLWTKIIKSRKSFRYHSLLLKNGTDVAKQEEVFRKKRAREALDLFCNSYDVIFLGYNQARPLVNAKLCWAPSPCFSSLIQLAPAPVRCKCQTLSGSIADIRLEKSSSSPLHFKRSHPELQRSRVLLSRTHSSIRIYI